MSPNVDALSAGGPIVAVVDYGAGNLVSIEQALTHVGLRVRVATDPAGLRGVAAVVVPGVGAAAPAMRRLARAGLVDPLLGWVAAGRPYIGICLGLQLLFERSDEDGASTLGVLRGRTVRLDDAPTRPHIGWNQVHRRREHVLFDGLAQDEDLYFVHSFAGRQEGPDVTTTLAVTRHGGSFVSAVERDNVIGVQFHPERSGVAGLRMLRNVAGWIADRDRAASGAPARPVTLASSGGA